MASEVVCLEDVQVLLYLARKNGSYENINEILLDCLEQWFVDQNCQVLEILLFGLQADKSTSEFLLGKLNRELEAQEHTLACLSLLERMAKPAFMHSNLLNWLLNALGSTENAEEADLVAKVCVIQLSQSTLTTDFRDWWRSIVLCLHRTWDKRFVSAGFKVWLACLTYMEPETLEPVIFNEASTYFSVVEEYLSQASKFALQILDRSLSLVTVPINNEHMTFDPSLPETRASWSRYISVVEVLGIDASVHQTRDSLPDFVTLLAPESPIPANWIIAMVNVGAFSSNTDGVRNLVIQLLLRLPAQHLWAFAAYPKFVARRLYPRFLQTANFVFVSGYCPFAERLETFTSNFMTALVRSGNVQEFVHEFANQWLEHCHCFEAPRVLVVDAMLRGLPAESLSSRETDGLLRAAKSTVATYNCRAMAELCLAKMMELVAKCGPFEDKVAEDIGAIAVDQLTHQSYLERDLVAKVAKIEIDFDKPVATACSLVDLLWPLQYSRLQEPIVSKTEVHALLERSLREPSSMSPAKRARLSMAAELAFDYIGCADFALCELAFAEFNEATTRLAALKAFKRSRPVGIAASQLETLWTHMQDSKLRIIDRDLHHEFIDLLTTPNVISADDWAQQQQICFEIVKLSEQRRNLLVPLAQGLQRCEYSWAATVMARIFAFIGSSEYSIKLEEQVALRFGVFEQYWGYPDSHARGIAAAYLKFRNLGTVEVTNDTMRLATLDKTITGSFDNLQAHRRILYYQILILIQNRWSLEVALEILGIVRASLEHEPNPPVRMHAEWLIALIGATHLSSSFAEFALKQISELDMNSGIPPRIIGSLTRVALLLYFTAASDENIGMALVERLIPLAATNKAVVRHSAVSALFILNKNHMVPPFYERLVGSITDTTEISAKASELQGDTYLWNALDTRLANVCGNVCSIVYDRDMPNTLGKDDFDQAENTEDLGEFYVSSGRRQRLPEVMVNRDNAVTEALDQASALLSTQIQTKSGNFDHDVNGRRSSLIVVATFCDKPVNLGAICRLSDALGASKLVVSDLEVVKDHQFKATALTAEKWLPLEQVSKANLPEYLSTMKAAGYTLVGIEQTDSSKILRSNLGFPEKTLLLMGAEKLGVPADILMLLDACVEIEQLGYVRSMNIQTATAIVVQAYNQNHSRKLINVDYLN